MKIATDLEQSKKLAEILPLESADMYYSHEFVNSVGDYYKLNIVSEGYFDDEELLGSDIPCWSLAALLGVIPKKINFGYENYSTFDLKPLENGKYLADYYDVSSVKDNPVDACYEMILKLHELDLV